jgi:hypothetical protein
MTCYESEAEKQILVQKLGELVQSAKLQRARVEELFQLEQGLDMMLPGLTAAAKQYSHLLVAIHEMELKLACYDDMGEMSVLKRASRGQSKIRDKRTSAPSTAVNPLAKPPEVVKKRRPAMTMATRKLPAYAAQANRERLVLLLCKGNCVYVYTRKRGACLSWAEMNADYPGQEVLWRTERGDFRARCLRCGATALDCYNWFR